jgi:ribosomal protein L44E
MFRRVYGTPEEIQSEEYVSPITSMFSRAWERHFQELLRPQESGPRNMQRHGESITLGSETAERFNLAELGEGPDTEAQRPPSERRFEGIRRGAELVAARATHLRQMIRSQPMFAGLDGDDRPEPLTDDQMTVKLECKVCLTQKADIACIPCGHLSMCNWCADQLIPVRDGSGIPKERRAQCPVCRKGVKRRVKIFTV